MVWGLAPGRLLGAMAIKRTDFSGNQPSPHTEFLAVWVFIEMIGDDWRSLSANGISVHPSRLGSRSIFWSRSIFFWSSTGILCARNIRVSPGSTIQGSLPSRCVYEINVTILLWLSTSAYPEKTPLWIDNTYPQCFSWNIDQPFLVISTNSFFHLPEEVYDVLRLPILRAQLWQGIAFRLSSKRQ